MRRSPICHDAATRLQTASAAPEMKTGASTCDRRVTMTVHEHLRHARSSRGDRLNPSLSHPRYWVLRSLRDAMKELLASPTVTLRGTVVDFGAGDSPYRALFQGKCQFYVAADLPGNPGADAHIAPDGTLPLADGSVDCVLSTQVLEHVADPHAYLVEARRVLKADGCLILSTHGMWRYHPDPCDYWRWTLDGLTLELERAGFQVLEYRSVMRLASNGLLMLQDSVLSALPSVLKRPFSFMMQRSIGVIERLSRRSSPDGCVFVSLARPASSGNLDSERPHGATKSRRSRPV
jgi:SAM-dependent methyltransferase